MCNVTAVRQKVLPHQCIDLVCLSSICCENSVTTPKGVTVLQTCQLIGNFGFGVEN